MIRIKISFYTLFLFITFSHLTYSQDSLIIDTEDYRLFYVGETVTTKELKSKFIAGTAFVNIPIDSSFYISEYPNPFSPTMVKGKFLYQISDTSDISISILNTEDSILFNLELERLNNGYYYFLIKSNYFMQPSINKKLFSSYENFRIFFVIKEEEFIIPLRN